MSLCGSLHGGRGLGDVLRLSLPSLGDLMGVKGKRWRAHSSAVCAAVTCGCDGLTVHFFFCQYLKFHCLIYIWVNFFSILEDFSFRYESLPRVPMASCSYLRLSPHHCSPLLTWNGQTPFVTVRISWVTHYQLAFVLQFSLLPLRLHSLEETWTIALVSRSAWCAVPGWHHWWTTSGCVCGVSGLWFVAVCLLLPFQRAERVKGYFKCISIVFTTKISAVWRWQCEVFIK